jgi:hypothetical protein
MKNMAGARRNPQDPADQRIERDDAEFAAWDDDPWQSVKRALNVISLDAVGGDVEDDRGRPGDDVDEPESDRTALLATMERLVNNVLSREEQHVLIERLLGFGYAAIAARSRPRISGPSQARKIEQRALRKLRERLSRFHNTLTPKVDKPRL